MKVENNILLVPVDFEDYSSKSIKYAKKLNKDLSGEIHLVHVITNKPGLNGIFKNTIIRELAEKKLKAIIKEFNLPHSTIIKVLEGVRHKQILEYADSANPRYIILVDNYPSKGVKKIGSTLSRIIISSKFPVITAKSVPESFFKKVLLPLDLTRNCSLKLNKSVKLAQKYNSEIKIASVLFGSVNKDNLRINEKLDQYKQVYNKKGVKHTVKLIKKNNLMAFKEILKVVEEYNCDSILIMTHKETGIDNYLGAFAHHIINEAKIPVISITKQAAKRDKYSLLTPFVDPFGILTKQMT